MKFLTRSVAVCAFGFLPTTGLAEFSGAYVGAGINGFSSQIDLSFDGEGSIDLPLQDNVAFSGFAGYQLQSGLLVYGAEIALSRATNTKFSDELDISFDTTATDIKGRLGYVFDEKLMAYGTAGYTTVTIEADGEDEDGDGFLLGAGVDYLLTDNVILGAEFATRQVEGSVDDIDVNLNINSVALRASFKF